MIFQLAKTTGYMDACCALSPCSVPAWVRAAEDHVLNSAHLHNAIVKAAETRQNDLAKIRTLTFFGHRKKALTSVKIDSRKIKMPSRS